MNEQKITEIRVLLTQTEEAHGEYESRELKGVYDQNWPHWYANYIISIGLPNILQREVGAEVLNGFLANSFEEFKKDNRGLGWEDYTAREIFANFYQLMPQ